MSQNDSNFRPRGVLITIKLIEDGRLASRRENMNHSIVKSLVLAHPIFADAGGFSLTTH